MCVVALAWRVHPDWPLILVGNRDEFHERPSAALAAWDDGSGIVAGRVARGRVATVSVNSFVFKQPVQIGDVLSLYADVLRIGNTSITVDV